MAQMLSLVLAALMCLDGSTTPPAAPPVAAERTSPVRSRAAEQWELEYQAGPLRLYKDGESGEAFWYATYTLVNRTGRPRSVAPQWEILDEDGRLFAAGDGVPRRVNRAVESLLANPLHEDQANIIGEILPGEENARSGFVVWKAGPEVRRFSVLVTGLSNTKKPAVDPVSKKPIVLKKTRRIDYQMACDRAALIGEVPLAPVKDDPNPRWIMR
jgi:hypothetical protein